MYDRTLVPTDGSDGVLDAAKHAFSPAERHDASVRVLSVSDRTENTATLGQGEEKSETLREQGANSTRRIVEDVISRDIETTGAVEFGDPDRSILEYADEHDIDVIVLSTNARSGIGRFLMGSVTEKVIRDGETPVLAVQR